LEPGIVDGAVALQARAVGKRFRGGVRALDGIDLDIPVGSICALVGPNGAGKSTLMKAWVGFERPSSGSVAVFGINPWRDKPAALDRIGYVSQKPALYRGLTVADHVALAGTLRSSFDPSLAIRRLDELAIPLGQDTRTLSGGQQAQVMLALALGPHARSSCSTSRSPVSIPWHGASFSMFSSMPFERMGRRRSCRRM
jgi:ABC-2 type transport system ATP-binding protein